MTNNLLAHASALANLPTESVVSRTSAPDWGSRELCPWQQFISSEMRKLWPTLSDGERLSAFVIAFEAAKEASASDFAG